MELSANFPSIVLGPQLGQWWRVHRRDHGPWWFASDDRAREQGSIGRFDLPAPYGTCYLGAYLAATASEVLRETGVPGSAAQSAAEKRRLSQMPLDGWFGKRIADFTSGATEFFGAPEDIATLERSEARPFAKAAHDAGFMGILYRLKEDPRRRLGLALFGEAGEHPAPGQPPSAGLPVGLRRELTNLFDGENRGDPLPK